MLRPYDRDMHAAVSVMDRPVKLVVRNLKRLSMEDLAIEIKPATVQAAGFVTSIQNNL